MFCAPRLFFDGTEGVVSRFHVLHAGLVFDGIEGVESRFHFLRVRTRFCLYQGRRLSFSYFALPDTFSAVPMGPVFIFCAPRLVFGGTEAVGSVFMFCAPRLLFDGTEGVMYRFHVLRVRY
jgi:hypothetical protein